MTAIVITLFILVAIVFNWMYMLNGNESKEENEYWEELKKNEIDKLRNNL